MTLFVADNLSVIRTALLVRKGAQVLTSSYLEQDVAVNNFAVL